MAKWSEQFEIIKDKIIAELAKKSKPYSRESAAELFGVKPNKVRAWEEGQRPSAGDLETIAMVLGLSPVWLLLGHGEPEAGQRPRAGTQPPTQDFSAENAKGKLIGDILWELLHVLNLDEKSFAKKVRLPIRDVQDILASRRKPTFDELAAIAQRLGISPAWLLIEQPPHFLARDLLARIEQATGCSTMLGNLHWAVGAEAQDMRDWLKAPGAKTFLPEEWMRGIVRRYHVSPQWLLHGVGPSHLSQEEVERIAPSDKELLTPPGRTKAAGGG